MACFWPCQGAHLTRLAATARGQGAQLETCRNDLDVCPWLEAKKNGPLRKDREKGRPGKKPAREVGVGVVFLAGHGQEARVVWAAEQGRDYL